MPVRISKTAAVGIRLPFRRPSSSVSNDGLRLATAAPPAVAEPAVADPETTDLTGVDDEVQHPWVVLVWNDPINLMSYVVYVFQTLFGYNEDKATKLMLDVHHKGRAAVSSGSREKAELDVSRLHEFGLWATMQQDS